MRKHLLLTVLSLLALFSACKDIYIVPSLRPLYTNTDTIFDPDLLGTWVPKTDSNESLTFAKGEHDSYIFVTKNDKIETRYSVYLVRINGHLFLDMLPIFEHKDNLYSSLLLPVHTFFVVRQISPTLIFDALDSQWMVKAIEDNESLIEHQIIQDKYILLTAPPEALQVFLVKNIRDAFHKSTDGGLIKKSDAP